MPPDSLMRTNKEEDIGSRSRGRKDMSREISWRTRRRREMDKHTRCQMENPPPTTRHRRRDVSIVVFTCENGWELK